VAKICPRCGSAHIDHQELLSPKPLAACLNCDWSGAAVDLLTLDEATVLRANPDGDLASPETTLRLAKQMSEAFLRQLAKSAGQPIGQALVEVGFVGRKDTANLTRLIRKACLSAVVGVLEELEVIQKEKQGAGRNQ